MSVKELQQKILQIKKDLQDTVSSKKYERFEGTVIDDELMWALEHLENAATEIERRYGI